MAQFGGRIPENTVRIEHTWDAGTILTSGRDLDQLDLAALLKPVVGGFIRVPRGYVRLRHSAKHSAHRRKIDAAAQAIRDAGHRVEIIINDFAPRPAGEAQDS